jgi:hypothetical protein
VSGEEIPRPSISSTAHWGTCAKTRPCRMISPRSRPMEIGGTKCVCCYRRMDRAGTASYPDRRVLLAGDAVQVQSPKVGHSLRPWRSTSAARSPDARSRPRQRQGLTAPFHVVAPCPPFLLNLGEPGVFDIGPWADRSSLDRRPIRGYVGASCNRGGHGSHSGFG